MSYVVVRRIWWKLFCYLCLPSAVAMLEVGRPLFSSDDVSNSLLLLCFAQLSLPRWLWRLLQMILPLSHFKFRVAVEAMATRRRERKVAATPKATRGLIYPLFGCALPPRFSPSSSLCKQTSETLLERLPSSTLRIQRSKTKPSIWKARVCLNHVSFLTHPCSWETMHQVDVHCLGQASSCSSSEHWIWQHESWRGATRCSRWLAACNNSCARPFESWHLSAWECCRGHGVRRLHEPRENLWAFVGQREHWESRWRSSQELESSESLHHCSSQIHVRLFPNGEVDHKGQGEVWGTNGSR